MFQPRKRNFLSVFALNAAQLWPGILSHTRKDIWSRCTKVHKELVKKNNLTIFVPLNHEKAKQIKAQKAKQACLQSETAKKTYYVNPRQISLEDTTQLGKPRSPVSEIQEEIDIGDLTGK